MKFIVFYLEFINSFEGPGMFFSSAAIIRRLRSYAATTINLKDSTYCSLIVVGFSVFVKQRSDWDRPGGLRFGATILCRLFL